VELATARQPFVPETPWSNKAMSNIITVTPATHRDKPHDKPIVIALHCSGSSRRQWRQLTTELDNQFTVIAPDLFGAGAIGPWFGDRPFQLSDEAALTVDIIDASEAPVHLVGHSYGGAVALRAAIERPNRIASLALYEPTAFHVLRSMGPDGRAALESVRAFAAKIEHAILVGAYRKAVEQFVDYWNGPGACAAMSSERRTQVGRYLPKACLDFRALFNEAVPLVAYRRLRVPVLLMRGEHAPEPTSLITGKLTSFMQPASVVTIAGASHMGPVTHARVVAEAIGNFIRSTEPIGGSMQGRRAPLHYAA
jgi:pimeloyl-ACP methyl ester carboxylesterase